MSFRLIEADCVEGLAMLEAGSVQCVVTSPPYWGLRDYGTAIWEGGDPECDHVESRALKRDTNGGMLPAGEGTRGTQSSTASSVLLYREICGKCGARRIDQQLGLESTPEQYVERMVEVFREIRRVLRDDGTVWLNLGDSYTGNATSGSPETSGLKNDGREEASRRRTNAMQYAARFAGAKPPKIGVGLKPKDLVGVPWRVAFALQADGWWLRSDIIWAKPNPMPESVTDRPTKSHEYLFLLTKSARYYYDADAVREPPTGQTSTMRFWKRGMEDAANGQRNDAGRQLFLDGDVGRNLRSVWNIATEPYPEAHFATFPKALVTPCVKAGTSEKGCCPECGQPFERVMERHPLDRGGERNVGGRTDGFRRPAGGQTFWDERSAQPDTTIGWATSCGHFGSPMPCTVLDPFCGSGTVGVVALREGRSFIGIDLNPTYIEMARDRILGDAPLFNVEAL